MFEYEYTRDQLTSGIHLGLWDIDNPDRLDGEGNQIFLSNEILLGLSKNSNIICSGTLARIIFQEELTTEEKSQLDTIVYNHKHNL